MTVDFGIALSGELGQVQREGVIRWKEAGTK